MLSEQIYRLRRSCGLSQEQLAGQIGVSRQAVSKWESGASVPELDKLIALSEYFGVSVDELTAGKAPSVQKPEPEDTEKRQEPETVPAAGRLGIGLCLAGVLLLLLAGAALLFFPAAAERLDASSAVTVSGSGLLFLLAAAAIAAGVLLIFRKK